MLSAEVISELFRLTNHVNDILIEHITDELWAYRLKVIKVDNCDVYLYIDFVGPNDIVGELRIDRFQKQFQISASDGNGVIMPASGDWSTIVKYLMALS